MRCILSDLALETQTQRMENVARHFADALAQQKTLKMPKSRLFHLTENATPFTCNAKYYKSLIKMSHLTSHFNVVIFSTIIMNENDIRMNAILVWNKLTPFKYCLYDIHGCILLWAYLANAQVNISGTGSYFN